MKICVTTENDLFGKTETMCVSFDKRKFIRFSNGKQGVDVSEFLLTTGTNEAESLPRVT